MSGSDIFLAMLVKPLAVIAFFGSAALIVWGLNKVIPEGPLKTFFFRVRDIDSPSPEHEKFWVRIVLILVIGGFWVWVWWMAEGRFH